MVFYYDIGGDDEHIGDTISYEPTWDEIRDAVYELRDTRDICRDYAKDVYFSESDIDRKIDNEYNFYGTEESIRRMSNDDINDFVNDRLQEYVEDFGYLEDELSDYFEQDAIEAHEDQMEYMRDPYAYYGLRRSDF